MEGTVGTYMQIEIALSVALAAIVGWKRQERDSTKNGELGKEEREEETRRKRS